MTSDNNKERGDYTFLHGLLIRIGHVMVVHRSEGPINFQFQSGRTIKL